jgi:lipopolysaccharide export system protein LptA
VPAVVEEAPATAPTPIKVATAQPTTKPDEAPVYIFWTGPLHVIPHSEASVPLHKQIVTLIGTPVVAQQKNSQMLASKLVYNTDDGSLKATSPGVKGVELRSSDPQHGNSDIYTTMLDYFSRANPPTAVLSGPSNAQLPTEANGPPLKASWNERCMLRMQSMPNNGTELKEADLTGAVHIDHPQLRLDSQRLELFFVPSGATRQAKRSIAPVSADSTSQSPEGQTNLKQLVASDNVHCVMFDSQHKEQTIDTNRLTVLTEPGPDGKLVPRTVNADGDVRAEDEDQILYAGHLATTLMPSTKPATTRRSTAVASANNPTTQPSSTGNQAIDLQSLIAQDRVHVVGKKNSSQAFADTMLVDNVNGKKTVKLIGQPFAEVIDKTNHIYGPIIDLASDDQQMAIDGPGHMVGVQQDGPTTRPMDVVWTQNMRGDGRTNLVNAYGNVVAKTLDADGRVSEVRGDHAELHLADAPATQPTHKPATQVASTHPTSKPTGEEAMARKTIRSAIFTDNAHVSSTLLDAEGLILQRMNLYSSVVQYDVLPAPPGSPPGATMKKVTVPVPGTMLVEDYTKPEAEKADTSSPTGGASSRGATAFKWQKTMIYDDSTHRSIMDGDVIIDHLDDLNKDNGMHMTADTVIADLMSAPLAPVSKTPATTKPTTKPDTGPHLRHVEAIGHVHVIMKNGELYASRIEYDPVTRIMIAHGTPDTDAVFSRTVATAGGTQPMRGQLLQWDAANDLPTIIEGAGEMRR